VPAGMQRAKYSKAPAARATHCVLLGCPVGDQFAFQPARIELRGHGYIAAERQQSGPDAATRQQAHIGGVRGLNRIGSGTLYERENPAPLQVAGQTMTPRGALLGSYPQFMQHQMNRSILEQRRQMRHHLADDALRMKSVADELKTDPVGLPGCQPLAREPRAFGPVRTGGQPQRPFRLLCVFDVAVVEGEQPAGVSESAAGASQLSRIVADAILTWLQTARNECDTHRITRVWPRPQSQADSWPERPASSRVASLRPR
jgi:hypothetical protein